MSATLELSAPATPASSVDAPQAMIVTQTVRPWLPMSLAGTAAAVPIDALARRLPNTLRTYILPTKMHKYVTTGATVYEMLAVSGRVVGLNISDTTDRFGHPTVPCPFRAVIPRVSKIGTGNKKQTMSAEDSKRLGPPAVIELYSEKTVFLFAKGICSFVPIYDIISCDIMEELITGKEGAADYLQERVSSVAVIRGQRGGLWRQRYANAVLQHARFAPNTHFKGFFHALERAKQDSADSKDTYFDLPSAILVVFGGNASGRPVIYHSAQEQATLCSMGGDTPGMLATGVASAVYLPMIQNSNCPIEVTFNVATYTQTPQGDSVLQTTQTVAIFNPANENKGPALLPGVQFATVASLLSSANGSCVKGLLHIHSKWRGVPGAENAGAFDKDCTTLVVRNQYTPASTAVVPMGYDAEVPTGPGMHCMGSVPRAIASLSTVLDFSDLIFSPSAVLLSVDSLVVQEALVAETANFHCQVNPADIQELNLRVPGATVGLCPEMAVYLPLTKCEGLVFYAVDITGAELDKESRDLIMGGGPGSEVRAKWVKKLMAKNMLVLVTCPTEAVREFLARPVVREEHRMLPTGAQLPSQLSTVAKAYLNGFQPPNAEEPAALMGADAKQVLAEQRKSRSRSRSHSPARTRTRSRSRSKDHPEGLHDDDLAGVEF